jgi:hypothetical protein
MEVPGLLEREDWGERADAVRERVGDGEDAEIGGMEEPAAATAAFCRRFGVFCPNPEIRAVMEAEE